MHIQSELKERLISAASAHSLPDRYVEDFIRYVAPVLETTLLNAHFSKPQILGVQGCQGSGKSTLCEFLKIYIQSKYRVQVEACSLDDFYLTRHERTKLSKTVHPLLATRGVPGTHEVKLIHRVFDEFIAGSLITVPSFDKASDDRAPSDHWPVWSSSPSVLIFEGWCVGMTQQSEQHLRDPVNELEELEDAQLLWRQYVNSKLKDDYQKIYARLDSLLVLQAPSFDCVFDWRLKQEQRLIANLQQRGVTDSKAMKPNDITRFISHYQRLTEHGFATLPVLADATLYLNQDHSFDRVEVA